MVVRFVLSSLLVFVLGCTAKQVIRDPSIIYVCDVNGMIMYPPDGESTTVLCKTTYPLIWHQGAPLLVYADTIALEALTSAVEHWNEKLGFEMLRMTPDLGAADVVVMDAPVDSTRYVGSTKHVLAATRMRAGVILFDVDVAYVVLLHELGHVLGLGHDLDPQSIMRPSIDTLAPNADIAETDLRALRALYRPTCTDACEL